MKSIRNIAKIEDILIEKNFDSSKNANFLNLQTRKSHIEKFLEKI